MLTITVGLSWWHSSLTHPSKGCVLQQDKEDTHWAQVSLAEIHGFKWKEHRRPLACIASNDRISDTEAFEHDGGHSSPWDTWYRLSQTCIQIAFIFFMSLWCRFSWKYINGVSLMLLVTLVTKKIKDKLGLPMSDYPELSHYRDSKAHLWEQIVQALNVAGECCSTITLRSVSLFLAV